MLNNGSVNEIVCSLHRLRNATDYVRCVRNDVADPSPPPPPPALASVILDSIQRNYYPFLIVLGFVGNILSVCVFASTGLKKFSSSYYLTALAISDTFFLFNVAIKWLDVMGIPLFGMNFVCQMVIYTTYVSTRKQFVVDERADLYAMKPLKY